MSGLTTAIELMSGFAERTGLSPAGPQQRYLWTDAFAVCNFLGLWRRTGEERYRELALKLVDLVHHTLGRHRDDDVRSGWLSGLSDGVAEAHPTRGGLRIGKRLPERGASEPFDEGLEWERDGQYFHYLTKWMHCLDLVARSRQGPHFNRWARELAETAHRAFTYRSGGSGRLRLRWKMSIDLSRPLVPSMGQHDPLDGLVTFAQLRSTGAGEGPDLTGEVAELTSMVRGGDWATWDALGLGGLLVDAYRVQQLAFPGGELLDELLEAAAMGLFHYARQGELKSPAPVRLAFRELGLAIGLSALEGMLEASPRPRVEALAGYLPLRAEIEAFWLEPDHRQVHSWTSHRDINEVMLAAALLPEGCTELPDV